MLRRPVSALRTYTSLLITSPGFFTWRIPFWMDHSRPLTAQAFVNANFACPTKENPLGMSANSAL